MTAFCLPQGQYTSLHLDAKQKFHPFQTNKKTTTSSISLTSIRMAQGDTNQSKKKIANRELIQPRPWPWWQCKKKKNNWFYDQNNSSALTPRFLIHLWRPLHDNHMKPSNVIFYGGGEDTRTHFPTSLFEARWSPYEFNSIRNHLHLINWAAPNRRDKVWKDAN